MVVELLLRPPTVVPGVRKAGLHGRRHLGEPAINDGAGLGEPTVDIGPDLGEPTVETTIEEAEHRHQDPHRGQLERHQADEGAPEYGWIDSHHARSLKKGGYTQRTQPLLRGEPMRVSLANDRQASRRGESKNGG